MSQNAGGKQITITKDPLWNITIQFKGPKKTDFKKKVWEFHMNEGCLIVVWYDRFDQDESPHKTIEVWNLADISYSRCQEIERPEPKKIIAPKGIIGAVN